MGRVWLALLRWCSSLPPGLVEGKGDSLRRKDKRVFRVAVRNEKEFGVLEIIPLSCDAGDHLDFQCVNVLFQNCASSKKAAS